MSVKHIKEYYQQVCDDYSEMLENIKDFEEELKTSVVEPERLDKLKSIIKPLKENWERLNYIIFLLNKPNNKKRAVKYNKLIKDKGVNCLLENKEVLKNLKNI